MFFHTFLVKITENKFTATFIIKLQLKLHSEGKLFTFLQYEECIFLFFDEKNFILL